MWAINPDGTGNVQITTAAGADRFPVPSPDGTRVAYAKLATLSVMNPDGTGSVSLGVNSVTNPDWQPAQEVPVVAPVVSKTAFSQVNREIRWRVRKSADASKAGWDPKDGSVAVRYGVRVTRSLGAPEAPVVYGAVRIQNPNEVPISITEVEDLLPDASCSRYVPSAPLVVPAGGEQFVSYSCALSEVPGGTLTNTARVYWSYDGEAGEAVQATADVDFSDPRVQVYGEMAVRVTDTMSGAKTRVLAEAMETSKTFTYTRYLRATDKCRWFGNTARLVVDGGAAEQQLQPAPGPAPEFEVIASDDAGVKICPPPPPPVKPDPTDPKAPPVVVIDNGNGSTPTKVPTKTTDNPKGPVIDSPVSKGRLVVSKRADSRRVRVGDVVTWTIRVRNAGKADLKDVVLVDRLPAHLRAVDTTATGTAKARQRARVIKVTVGDLLVGQSTTVRVATKVVARPRMTRRVAREASRIRSKQVRVRTLRRARLGVVCNTAFAKAQATRARAGVGCIRVLAPVKPTTPEVVQTPEN